MNDPTTESQLLSSRQAAALLGVSVATIYSYVSRGLIRSERVGGGRERRYHRADLVQLKRRAAARHDRESAAHDALRHSDLSVLDSALTAISEQDVTYRGFSATRMARTHSFEQVAALLWLHDTSDSVPELATPALPLLRTSWVRNQWPRPAGPLPVWEALQAVLPRFAADDAAALDLQASAAARTGGRILAIELATVSALRGRRAVAPEAPVIASVGWMAASLTAALVGPDQVARLAPLVRAALVLLADHELNVSTMAARTAASARATPYQAVLAGLAALHGSLHGGASELARRLFAEIGRPERARAVIRQRLHDGEPLYGFGHRIYRSRDPRAQELIAQLRQRVPDSPALALFDAITAAVAEHVLERPPNVDAALATLALACRLPPGATETLFAVSRTAGWIAHAIEHYEHGGLLRPRARYVGPPPQAPS